MSDEPEQSEAREVEVKPLAIEELRIDEPKSTASPSSLTPHCHFTIQSHNVCYGSLHNIWHGANSPPLMTFPAVVRPRLSGTVKTHQLGHNVPAKNGTWLVFQLVDVKSRKREVCGWFACHEDIDPLKEIDKILRVSGSPYEPDSGSSLNNDETSEAGVLVINRYDWGDHDDRDQNLFSDSDETFLTVGIVDRTYAVDEVDRWKSQRATDRTPSEWGVWMYVPESEYLFGRFGFDDIKMNAQSFLFFTGSTYFTQTAFSGLDSTLRMEETHEERFERRLLEGYDFSGIKTLKELIRPPPFPVSQAYKYEPPPLDQRLGPYDKAEHLFKASDIDALRMYTHVGEIAVPEMERVTDLLNELMMTYLERFILHQCSCRTLEQATTAFFPTYSNSAGSKGLVYYLHRFFTNASTDPPVTCGYESEAVDSRIRAFLTARCSGGDDNDGMRASSSMALDQASITGINRMLQYLLTELMKLGYNVARDSWRDRMVPSDFRISVFHDPELLSIFQYSRVYWEGR